MMRFFKRLRNHKNNKALYYIRNFIRYFVPKKWCKVDYEKLFATLSDVDKEYVSSRVDYYNKLENCSSLGDEGTILLADFKLPKKKKGTYANRTYFFDTYEYTRCFSDKFRIVTLFGDITEVPPVPSITKLSLKD